MDYKKPKKHRMTRRSASHDYTRNGVYHITLHVADALGQPLGTVMGNLSAPDGTPDAPRTVLTPIGKMVEQELLTSIHAHYAMVSIQDYVIMPEHLHFLAIVQDTIISIHGSHQSLGQVIAGFKKGCNKRYWEMAQAANSSGKTAAHTAPDSDAETAAPAVGSVPGGSPAGHRKVPSSAATGRQPLFAPGFCDVMPVDAAQLATQRAYINGNPRSRLQRMSNRSLLTVQRAAITTALTPSALRGYLQRECPLHLATTETLAAIESRLLITAGPAPSGNPAGKTFIACDIFGNRALLTEHRCLPVVCHRKDTARFSEQKARCLEEAACGTVLVSASISPNEREIVNECVSHGFPVVIINDNGFPDRYHPSAERLDLCTADRMLLVSPWSYQYRGKDEQVTVPFCKAMNCVAQALCRTKDSWWQ